MPSDSASVTPRFDILGLGVSILDWIQVIPAFPEEDVVIRTHQTRLMGGGPVATALSAAAELGGCCAMADRIGDDWVGSHIAEEFENHGVDTSWLEVQSGVSTAFASVLVRESDGNRAIVFTPGTATEFNPDEIETLPFSQSRLLHLNGRHWPACLTAAQRMRETGGLTSFDGGAHRFREEVIGLLPHIDISIVAREFGERLTNQSFDPGHVLDALLDYGATLAGVTDGAAGAWIAHRDGTRLHHPAFPLEQVVDTTGCGDVFHGAFLIEHLRGCPLEEATRRASAAAARNATGLGGRGCLASQKELAKFLLETPSPQATPFS